MVALIIILLCLIGIYSHKHKQLQRYAHRTATCVESHYDVIKRKSIGGAYQTTVRYEYDGVIMEERLQYTTRKFAPGATVQCLVDPNNPTKVYPYTARKTTRTIITICSVVLGFAIIILLRSLLWTS